MKTKVIFDFDNTLFNTQDMRKHTFLFLEQAGGKPTDIEDTYFETRKLLGSYDLITHVDLLSKIEGFQPEIFYSEWENIDMSKFIIEGAIDLLSKLKDEGYELTLLTKGIESFQNEKINRSGLNKFFGDSIYITNTDKKEILKKFKLTRETFFINDFYEENLSIQEFFPELNIILFEGVIISPDTSSQLKKNSVRNLSDLVPIIKMGSLK